MPRTPQVHFLVVAMTISAPLGCTVIKPVTPDRQVEVAAEAAQGREPQDLYTQYRSGGELGLLLTFDSIDGNIIETKCTAMSWEDPDSWKCRSIVDGDTIDVVMWERNNICCEQECTGRGSSRVHPPLLSDDQYARTCNLWTLRYQAEAQSRRLVMREMWRHEVEEGKTGETKKTISAVGSYTTAKVLVADSDDLLIRGLSREGSEPAEGASTPSKPQKSSVEKRLGELEALKKKGIISKSEYDTKRKEIIGEL